MEVNMSAELAWCKNELRGKATELDTLRREQQMYNEYSQQMQVAYQELQAYCQQIQDQYALLKVQKVTPQFASPPLSPTIAAAAEEGQAPALIDELRRENDELKRQLTDLHASLQMERMKLEQQPLSNNHVNHQDTVLSFGDNGVGPDVQVRDELARLKGEYNVLTERVMALERDYNYATSELDGVRKEQEDLLVLLTDQDTKLRQLRRRLRELGEPVDQDEEEEG
jgi:chromosome segregation ATPase